MMRLGRVSYSSAGFEWYQCRRIVREAAKMYFHKWLNITTGASWGYEQHQLVQSF